jgi:hypothetical protein
MDLDGDRSVGRRRLSLDLTKIPKIPVEIPSRIVPLKEAMLILFKKDSHPSRDGR